MKLKQFGMILVCVFTYSFGYSIDSFAKNDWCIDPSHPPCGGEEGECIMNSWFGQDRGGFVSNTATLEKGSFFSGRHVAYVALNAQVCGHSVVEPSVKILDHAQVLGHAHLTGNVQLHDSTKAYGKAWMGDQAEAFGNSHIYDEAEVFGNAKLYDAMVHDKVFIFGEAKVQGELSGPTAHLDPDPSAQTMLSSYRKDESGQTVVGFAASQGLIDLLVLGIQLGIDANQADRLGDTPLHHAASQGYEVLVHYLIKKSQINPSARNLAGMTPLFLAVQSKHFRIVDYLMESGYVNLQSEIKGALKRGQKKLLTSLLQYWVSQYCTRSRISYSDRKKRELWVGVLSEIGFDMTCSICLEGAGVTIHLEPTDQSIRRSTHLESIDLASCGHAFCTNCYAKAKSARAAAVKDALGARAIDALHRLEWARIELAQCRRQKANPGVIAFAENELKRANEQAEQLQAEFKMKKLECPYCTEAHDENEILRF